MKTKLNSHGWAEGSPLGLDIRENFPNEREAKLQRYLVDQLRMGRERK